MQLEVPPPHSPQSPQSYNPYHPEFQYPGSQNPYAEKIHDLATFPSTPGAFADAQTEQFYGRWREQFVDRPFQANRPLHVEIGCNGGHFLLGQAERNPWNAYVGLDWKYKQVFLGAQKMAKRGIRNAFFLRARAERIDKIFGPGEVDFLYCLFPDPWPKKHDAEHRILQPSFLRHASTVVRPGGRFEIRTDDPANFSWILESIEKSGSWALEDSTWDLHAGIDAATVALLEIPDVTLFERIYLRAGRRICRAILKNTKFLDLGHGPRSF